MDSIRDIDDDDTDGPRLGGSDRVTISSGGQIWHGRYRVDEDTVHVRLADGRSGSQVLRDLPATAVARIVLRRIVAGEPGRAGD